MKTKYLKHIENEIIKNITDNGGKILKTSTRIKKYDYVLGKGETEWIYTDEKTLDNAFINANNKYGGRINNDSLKHINNNANINKKNSTYTAEIHYKIY